MQNNILFVIFSYLFSSIPFGLLIGKVFYKIDIRKLGSKNIGATNVTRLCGKTAGFITFLLDGLKGAIPVMIYKTLYGGDFIYFLGIVAILGHIFPIYLKFKGGKGVATTILVLLAISPQIGLYAILIWILCLILFGFSSVSSICMSIFVFIFSLLGDVNINMTYFSFIFMCLILIRHKTNITKLLNKQESKSFKKSIF